MIETDLYIKAIVDKNMEAKQEVKRYKCKYCGEEFDKPVRLAQHIRVKHKRAKKREKEKIKRETASERINRVIEAVGILKGLQVSPNLSEGEKKILDDVLKRFEDFIASMQK
ncbi:C2H2-type zinc finger protein [Candidatus Alkanophaga liquidiphilum]